jgi:hypothetical protein
MPNGRDILYRVGYTRTIIDIASTGYEIGESRNRMAASLRSGPTVSSTMRTHSAWWQLARHRDSQTKVLTLAFGGSEMLPVFSFREEAEMYIRIEILGSDWRIRETGAGELVSVLNGPCASVRSVALDPLPNMLTDELVGLDRDLFVSRVVHLRR